MNPATDRVTVNRSGFDFTCPGCGIRIDEDDLVYTLTVTALVRWPVCEACGLDWCTEHKIADPLAPNRGGR